MRLIARGVFWFGLYMLMIVFPLLVGAVFIDPADSPNLVVNLAAALGYIGLALMSAELALVSRFKAPRARLAWTRCSSSTARSASSRCASWQRTPCCSLRPKRTRPVSCCRAAGRHGRSGSGRLALVATCLVVGLSVLRQRLRIPYEAWQITHGMLSIAVIALATVHIYSVGRFSEHPAMRVVWAAYLLAFVGMFLRYRVLRPLQLRKQPVGRRREPRRTRRRAHAEPAPGRHPGFTFEPGQFGWIGFGRLALSMSQHPDLVLVQRRRTRRGRTGRVHHQGPGRLVGRGRPRRPSRATRAWIDGPYGVFTIDREEGAGFVLIGGGVGITPLYSMVQALATRGDTRPVFLFHGANDEGDLTFRDEIAALAESTPNLHGGHGARRRARELGGRTRLHQRANAAAASARAALPPLPVLHLRARPAHGRHGRGAAPDRRAADRIHTERFDMV